MTSCEKALYQTAFPADTKSCPVLCEHLSGERLFTLENGVSISEAFSRTGYNISNARKLQFCKQPFEIIQGQVAFKNTVQCVNKQTVVLSSHPVCVKGGRIF